MPRYKSLVKCVDLLSRIVEMGDIIAIQVYRDTSNRRYVSRYTFYVSRYVLRIGPNWKFYQVSPHIICLKLKMLK